MLRVLNFVYFTFVLGACKALSRKAELESISELDGVPKLLQRSPAIPTSLADNFTELDSARKEYEFTQSKIPNVALTKNIPKDQEPDIEWSLMVLGKLRKMRENTLDFYNTLEAKLNRKYPQIRQLIQFKNVPESLNALDSVSLIVSKNFDSIIRYYLFKTGPINQGKGGRVNHISDYDLVFSKYPPPDSKEIVRNDDKFANAFVAGLNPMVIEGVRDLARQFKAINDATFKKVPGFSNDSLEVALREKRLYLVDLSIIGKTIPGKQHPSTEKYVYGPKGLFGVPKGSNSLKPLAITIDEEKAPQIITPLDGHMWMIAKTVLNSACANHHEIFAHLGQTHLIVDPIAVSCYRQLSSSHPLSRLMRPHFRGTMFINSLAVTLLAKKDEAVDLLLWGSSESNMNGIFSAVQQYSLNDLVVPSRFMARGLDNKIALPNLPYRDDALLLWDAMKNWVEAYVDAHYAQDQMVRNDPELKLWVREAQSPFAINVIKQGQDFIAQEQRDQSGGRLKSFGKNGAIETKDDLVSFLSVIMFTASAQHAAVNFPQADMKYAPDYPLALYNKVPSSINPTEKDFLSLLPPLDQAMLQLEAVGFLGEMYYSQVGVYPTFQFAADSRVHQSFNTYRQRLTEIERIITERNSDKNFRPYAYTHLLPSKVPISINI